MSLNNKIKASFKKINKINRRLFQLESYEQFRNYFPSFSTLSLKVQT